MSSGIRPNLNGLTVSNGHSVASPSGPLKLSNVTRARSNYSGQTYSPRAIQEMIVRESIKAGVNPRVMLMKVDIETGGTFDPWSRNSKTNAINGKRKRISDLPCMELLLSQQLISWPNA